MAIVPLYHRTEGFTLRIRFEKLVWGTVSLPLLSFIFCIIWSILYNFEKSTYTHCEVSNVLPSVSTAIDVDSTQRYVWRIAIVIHAVPRFLVVPLYYRYYEEVLDKRIQFMAKITSCLNVVEIWALIGLTFISSAENNVAHVSFFIIFMMTSELYMILACFLLQCKWRTPPDNIEAHSLRVKCKVLIINVISLAMALYFFFRHNWHCEAYVYTVFALCEYVVVLTNMAFHMTAIWDFHGRELIVSPLCVQFSLQSGISSKQTQ
ncbi:post-GPI attachment to proteins factor 2-like [Anabrus simplex]|uniref:post-GPI attachment to proteins factor 2-like n=1 Tax=Anabrus simplex TaxID=316456 RepID=UPI0035A3BA4B